MSQAKHTPAPWRVVPRMFHDVQSGYAIVADHESGWDDEDNVEAYGGHLIAESVRAQNAPLLAAAPLMLEALENLENDDGLRMPDSAWELVQQAVEAATGRRKPSAAEMRGES